MSEMQHLQRYQWEDCLIEAAALKLIPKGWANTALRLSRQFNWTPTKTGRAPGLYWANRLAARSVGVGESTFYEHVKGLKGVGFLSVRGGNLIPRLPENHGEVAALFAARVEDLTNDHEVGRNAEDECSDSSFRIPISGGDDSFTEDLCTDDLCTEDSLTEVDASHPAHAGGALGQEEAPLLPPDPSRGTSFFSLGSLRRRVASKTHSAAI